MTKIYKGSCPKDRFAAVQKSGRGKWIVRFNEVEHTEGEGEDERVIVTYDEAVMESKPDYASLVSVLIRIRYSIDAEIALSRQRENKPEEWSEYFDYCEECKSLAKSILDNNESPKD